MICMLMMLMLAPMATASDHLSLLAAAIDTNANATSNNTRTVSTDIASTIASWTSLSSSIAAAAGETATLTLSTPFDMTGFQSRGGLILMRTAQTAITIVGNAAVFDAEGKGRFFYVGDSVALVMSNVTLQNAYQGGSGGAIYVYGGGTITLSDCTFNGNTAGYGGALYFDIDTNGLLKNCSLLGGTVSPKNNDIYRYNTTANVTFACADGEVGTPVQMSGTEITKIPAPTCTTLYYCPSGAHACVPCDYIGCGGIKNLTECNKICI
jgi:predicted outer membrane repeat protein